MPSAFVAVHRTADPVEARFVADVLTTEGLEVRLIGTSHAAGIGAAQHIMKLRVEVARAQADEARVILDERLSTPMTLDPESIPDELRDDPDVAEGQPQDLGASSVSASSVSVQDALPSPRRAMFAIAAPFVFPGGSHFYVRRPWTGALILTAYLMALWLLSGPAPWATHMAAFVAIGLLVAFDLTGGLLGVRADRRGRPPRAPLNQLVTGVFCALVALGAGFSIGKAIPDSVFEPRPDNAARPYDPGAFRSPLPHGYNQMAPALYLFELVNTARGAE